MSDVDDASLSDESGILEQSGILERSEPQLATLQRLTSRLARITSSADVAVFVLNEGVRRVGGTSGSLCLVVDGELEITASHGYPGDVLGAYARFAIDRTTPAGECALTKQPVYCETIDELYRRYPIFRDGPIVGDPSVAVLPLEASDLSVLGTMVIGFSTPRRFSETEQRLLEALASEAAVALERARANEALVAARRSAELARDQLAFLADASARLAASLDLDETLEEIAALAVPRISDRCVLYLLEEELHGDELLRIPLAPAISENEQAPPDPRRPRLDDPTGVGAVVRTGEALFVPEVREERLAAAPQSGQRFHLLQRVGVGGTFLVPLNVRGRCIGALALVNRAGRSFSAPARSLAEELAARAAVAIDNARMFSREVTIAQTLQRALLPATLPNIPGVKFASRYAPGTDLEVGGDWYSAIALDEHRFVIVVGDVSGSGLHAATTMASVRHTVSALAFEGNPPASVLQKASRQLELEGRFATVLVGLVDLEANKLTIASAGHLSPLLLAGDSAAFVACEPGLPIGVHHDADYKARSVALPSQAMLIAFTDGLVERRGECIDEGLERLRESIQRPDADVEQLLSSVLDDLAPGGPADDVAILGVQWGR